MKRSWLTGVLVGLAVGAIAFAWTGALRAQGTGATGRMAAVDVGRVFEEYQRMKDIMEELKQLQDRLNAENDKRRQNTDALQATVDRMDREDPTYAGKLAEVLEAKVSYNTWREVQQAHTAREVALATDRIYRDILRGAEEVARQAAYDLVVYQDRYEPASMNPEELQAQLRSRRIIYTSPAIDVTQTVLDRLNAEYRSQPRKTELYVP